MDTVNDREHLSLAGSLGGDLVEQGISLLGLPAPGRQEQ
jgi:hypothetical protein